MRALFAERSRDGMRHIQIVLAIDSDQDSIPGLSFVITDKADVAVAVLARVDKLARERHQRGNIRRAKSAVTQLRFCRDRIADANAIIRRVTHASSR